MLNGIIAFNTRRVRPEAQNNIYKNKDVHHYKAIIRPMKGRNEDKPVWTRLKCPNSLKTIYRRIEIIAWQLYSKTSLCYTSETV